MRHTERAKAVRRSDRRDRMMTMLRNGTPVPEIAKDLGLSRAQTYREIRTVLDAVPVHHVADLREVTHQRCEAIIRAHLPLAQEGNTKSGELCIAAMREQARVWGLDAPTVTASLTATCDLVEMRERIESLISMPAQVVSFNPEEFRVVREPAELPLVIEAG